MTSTPSSLAELNRVYFDNVRDAQIGIGGGMSLEVAADIGYTTQDQVAQLVGRSSNTMSTDTDYQVAANLEYPYVDLLERNEMLGKALTSLANASKFSGLRAIAENDEFPGMRRRLESRYDDVDGLVGRTTDKQSEAVAAVKRQFTLAYGLEATIKAHPDQKKEFDYEANQDYLGFVRRFGDAKGAKERVGFRKVLAKQLKNINASR